jgi:hypothetical protein
MHEVVGRQRMVQMLEGFRRQVFLLGEEIVDDREKLIETLRLYGHTIVQRFQDEVNVVADLVDQDIGLLAHPTK